jgi:hypothetical protein
VKLPASPAAKLSTDEANFFLIIYLIWERRLVKKREEILNKLMQFNYFVVERVTNLPDRKIRSCYQTSIFNKVKLHWNGSVFKFWDNKNEDNDLYIASDTEFKWNGDESKLYIYDSLNTYTISCHNK